MKKIMIGLVCVLLAVTLVVPAIAESEPKGPVYVTNKEMLYQFQKPGKGWSKKRADEFNEYWFVRRDGSGMYIASRIYITSLEDFDLSATLHFWIEAMQEKYGWKDVKIIDEADATVDERSAFWSVTEFKHRGKARKEKIYLVQGDKFFYRLRISCPERYFDKHLEEFEQLVKSFKLLVFEAPIDETPTNITDKHRHYRFQRPRKSWSKKTAGFRDPVFTNNEYMFVDKIDYSTILIGSEKYVTSPEDFDLSATLHSWIETMQKKYRWTDVKIVDEVDASVDGHPDFWTVVEFHRGMATIKEKIYLVKGSKFYHHLRLTCFEPYFADHLEEFEQLVKSFRLLEKTSTLDE